MTLQCLLGRTGRESKIRGWCGHGAQPFATQGKESCAPTRAKGRVAQDGLTLGQKQIPHPGEAHGAQNPRCARDDNLSSVSIFHEAQ
jgi:hypothetical protein